MTNMTNAADWKSAQAARIAASHAKLAERQAASGYDRAALETQLRELAAQRAQALKDADRAYARALGMGTPEEVRAAGEKLRALRCGG